MKKSILCSVIVLCCASVSAQTSLHLQAGYFAPQVALKNEIINGPIASAGVIFNKVYESSFFAETKIDCFFNSNGRNRVDIYSWSWSAFAPIISSDIFCLSPSAGASLSRFSSQAPLAGRGSMAENPVLTAGVQFGIFVSFYNVTLTCEYLVREISGRDDQFKIGGLTASLGYIIDL